MTRTRILVLPLVLTGLVLVTAASGEPTLAWSDLYDGGAAQNDDGMAVLFSDDGHVITGGMHDTGSGYTDLLVRKLRHDDGSVIWSYSYADHEGNDLALSDLVIDHRGDVLVAGYLSSCDS